MRAYTKKQIVRLYWHACNRPSIASSGSWKENAFSCRKVCHRKFPNFKIQNISHIIETRTFCLLRATWLYFYRRNRRIPFLRWRRPAYSREYSCSILDKKLQPFISNRRAIGLSVAPLIFWVVRHETCSSDAHPMILIHQNDGYRCIPPTLRSLPTSLEQIG